MKSYLPDWKLDSCESPLTYFDFCGREKEGPYLGVELELESNGVEVQDIYDTLPNFVIVKEDGSLTEDGVEIVSVPATLCEHQTHWDNFFSSEVLKSELFADYTCGMHVHLGKRTLKPIQIGKMIIWMHEPNNYSFIQEIAGRNLRMGQGGTYAYLREIPYTLTDRVKVKISSNGKKIPHVNEIYNRGAMFFSVKNTIEFRIFRSVVDKEPFLRNIEFVHALQAYCLPGVDSFNGLRNPKGFLNFVRENRYMYKNLFAFTNTFSKGDD